MGPDCGTAVVGGVGLGFANVVRPGPVGLVAASGTGAQQVMSLLAAAGVGISHCLGVGGRDLSDAVGGASTHAALDALDADPDTELIVVLSKPPAPEVAEEVRAHAARLATPVLVAPLGPDAPDLTAVVADVLARLGRAACPTGRPGRPPCAGAGATAGWLRGLFSGGTLCVEAHGRSPRPRSGRSAPTSRSVRSGRSAPVAGRDTCMLDLGADEYTVGRPHPMLDSGPRLALLEPRGGRPALPRCSCSTWCSATARTPTRPPNWPRRSAPRCAGRRRSSVVVSPGRHRPTIRRTSTRQADAAARGRRVGSTCPTPPPPGTPSRLRSRRSRPVTADRAVAGCSRGEPRGGHGRRRRARRRAGGAGRAARPGRLAPAAAPAPRTTLARVAADPRRTRGQRRGRVPDARRRSVPCGRTTGRPSVVGLAPGQFCHAGPPLDWERRQRPDARRAHRRDAAGGAGRRSPEEAAARCSPPGGSTTAPRSS